MSGEPTGLAGRLGLWQCPPNDPGRDVKDRTSYIAAGLFAIHIIEPPGPRSFYNTFAFRINQELDRVVVPFLEFLVRSRPNRGLPPAQSAKPQSRSIALKITGSVVLQWYCIWDKCTETIPVPLRSLRQSFSASSDGRTEIRCVFAQFKHRLLPAKFQVLRC